VEENNIIVDKNRTLYTKLKNEMIAQKLLLLACLGEDSRRRSVITIRPGMYIHKCAVICPTNLKQIFHILIGVEPKNKVRSLLKFINKSELAHWKI